MGGKEIIEREEYLDKLYLWWERTKLKGGMTVIIKGDAGVGKTSLGNKFLEIVNREKPYIIKAEGFEEEIGPLVSFIDAIKRFIDEEKAKFTVEFLIKNVTNLSKIIPSLDTALETVQYTKKQYVKEKISSYIPTTEVQTFFDIFSFFEALANKKPVIIFIDDIQWLDASSRKLLYYLIKRIRNNKIFIIATYRTHFITSRVEEEADDFIKRLESKKGEERIEILELNILNRNDYPKLIQILIEGPHKFTESEIDFLYNQTEGNPKFLEQLLDLFKESKIISKIDDSYIFAESPDSKSIPNTIENTIKSRLERIYEDLPPSKDLLEFASAIGLRFGADRLEGITGKPLNSILDVLAKIERKYYLVKRCQKIVQYMFDHKKTQEVIYSMLGDVAQDMHYHIAVYLENEKEIDPFLIAYHYRKSLDYKKADLYFQIAARKSFEYGKFEDAIGFCEETLSIEKNFLQIKPSTSLLLLYAESLFLSYDIENALQQLLRLYNYREEMNLLEQARLEALIGKCYYTDGKNELVEKSFPYFKNAIIKYKELNEIERIIECYFDLAASYDHIGAYELTKSSVDDAMKLVDTINNPILSAIAFRRSYIYYNYQDFPIKLDETINIFEKNGEKRNLARLLNNLGVEYFEQGKVDKAREVLIKSLLLFEEVHAFEKDFPTNNLGALALTEGNYNKAEELLNIALSHHSEEFNRISILNNLAYLKTKTGEPNQAKDNIGYILDALQHFFDPKLKEKSLINIGIIYNNLGDHERAFNFISKTLNIDTTKKKDDVLTTIKLRTLIDIHKKAGENEYIAQMMKRNQKALVEEIPKVFKLSGYYPCLIAFYY